MTLPAGCEEEQQELKSILEKLASISHTTDDEAFNVERFLRVAWKYEDPQELTPTILRALIEKIVVF